MINTILFDLDGTLLPMDTEIFTKKYFKALAMKFKDHFTSEELIENIWGSTTSMIKSVDPDKTNEYIFFEDFYKRVDKDHSIINPLFNEFYEIDFNSLQDGIKKNEYMINSVKLLKEKGYKLVVATNPLFPKIAILHRVNWAGLDKDDFEYITNFEEMHYCKPQLNFYKEILEKIGKEPSDCMMIGNDIQEDMRAKELGISTYLIEDYIIGNSKDNDNIDYIGKYKDFYEFCKDLPSIY